jgi:hypothetical protein
MGEGGAKLLLALGIAQSCIEHVALGLGHRLSVTICDVLQVSLSALDA